MLDNTSTSFCHYTANKKTPQLISLEHLRQGIRFGMVENLMIQFVYPNYELPQAYKDEIETIDHSKIKPLAIADGDTQVVVVNGWDFNAEQLTDAVVVLRTDRKTFSENRQKTAQLLAVVQRLNIVITDIEHLTDGEREQYKRLLEELATEVENLYVAGKSPQFNLLTDRMMLTEMNNCNAGDTTVTLAPNGKFYICPAFYYENEADSVGDLEHGLDIKNKQLYRLDHAPICRKCDAWQCRRCAWLNRKTTLEVNTPSHEQCVAAHLERNASRLLLNSLRSKGTFLPDKEEIKEIAYLDPFETANNWK